MCVCMCICMCMCVRACVRACVCMRNRERECACVSLREEGEERRGVACIRGWERVYVCLFVLQREKNARQSPFQNVHLPTFPSSITVCPRAPSPPTPATPPPGRGPCARTWRAATSSVYWNRTHRKMRRSISGGALRQEPIQRQLPYEHGVRENIAALRCWCSPLQAITRFSSAQHGLTLMLTFTVSIAPGVTVEQSCAVSMGRQYSKRHQFPHQGLVCGMGLTRIGMGWSHRGVELY
jgi:hypothetical protein